jgi:hypothetical protein
LIGGVVVGGCGRVFFIIRLTFFGRQFRLLKHSGRRIASAYSARSLTDEPN